MLTFQDILPTDFSPTSMRTSQRDLMSMLLHEERNKSLQVSAPSIPNSVAVRGTSDSDEWLCDTIKCIGLGDLVYDCHYPVTNMPSAPAQHGLELRSYQKTSLQWLIDKETNPSGMGTAGELWFRM